MRLTNYRATKLIPGLYFFTIVLGFLVLFLYQIMGDQFLPKASYMYILEACIIFIIVLTYVNGRYFEFDSEGALIGFYTRGVLLSEMINYRSMRYDLKREKITDFKIHNFIIYKQLSVHYNSDQREKIIRLNISLLSPRKTRYLRKSLSKLVHENLSNTQT